MLCGTCGGGILILRQRNLSNCFAQISLSHYLDVLTVGAVNGFKDCNKKLYHVELLSGSLPSFFCALPLNQISDLFRFKNGQRY